MNDETIADSRKKRTLDPDRPRRAAAVRHRWRSARSSSTVSWFRQNMIDHAEQRRRGDAAVRRGAAPGFPGQQPLIQLVDGTPAVRRRARRRGVIARTLTTLHVLAYDRDEGNMVTFSLPFWLLRMKSGPIRISAYQQGWDDRGVSFRVEDIEKHGPGIIVDVDANGRRRPRA